MWRASRSTTAGRPLRLPRGGGSPGPGGRGAGEEVRPPRAAPAAGGREEEGSRGGVGAGSPPQPAAAIHRLRFRRSRAGVDPRHRRACPGETAGMVSDFLVRLSIRSAMFAGAITGFVFGLFAGATLGALISWFAGAIVGWQGLLGFRLAG